MTGPLSKKELPVEGCSTRNGTREKGSRKKKISVDRQHHDKWTVYKYIKQVQKRVERIMPSLQTFHLSEQTHGHARARAHIHTHTLTHKYCIYIYIYI